MSNADQPTLITPAGERLVSRLKDEPFALVFSGQGYAWLPTLRAQIAAGAGAAVAGAVEQARGILAPLEDELAPFTPRGFEPVVWANAAADGAPNDAVLASAAVSTPGILVAQIAVLESLQAQGLTVGDAVAAIGHSQGALATFVATGRAQAGEAIALARLIGAAITKAGRTHGLLATEQGAPMLAVSGATREQIEPALAGTGVHVGLINGRTNVVLVGVPQELAAVQARLEKQAARAAQAVEDKQRGGSPLTLKFTPLNIQAAYHHPAMADAVAQVEAWGAAVGLNAELVAEGARAVLTDVVDWPAQVRGAVDAGARWILECGPAGGVDSLTRAIVEGYGVGTLVVCGADGQAQLFDAGRAPQLPTAWSQFAPAVRAGQGDRAGKVVTKFTRATGYSPVMLPGMTPSTVDPAIVAAAANAGHWAELAGGGQTTNAILAQNLEKLEELLEPGVNAQFNAMYLSASQWRRQISGERAVPKARANGAPINGVIVSAGIPPLEEAVDLVTSLHADNFPWVAFKPGTVRQITQVLAIADALADTAAEDAATPLIMQIEGGHAGGHHSWEDLDELLLATYGQIRERANVILAVGGGIGTPERGAEYLLGTWAEQYGLPAAPVDAIMVGTAAMATAESTASESVKQALVAAQAATDNGGWAPAGGVNGGIASGRSQLGADIHEIDNSFAQAGRLLDEVAGDAEAVAARRADIIAAIDKTCKPYFGDVTDMTYAQWLERYLELSYLGEWTDQSWFVRFAQMVERAEARLNPADHGEFAAQVTATADNPARAVADLRAAYGMLVDLPVHVADADWFVQLLAGKGKPANFVPVIDAEVRRLWRQDSLWQAHDERYDADQVCIIPGTTAVAGIERANEPVAELLGRFEAAAAQGITAADAAPAEEARSVAEAIRQAPTVSWAGREQANPLHLTEAAQLNERDGEYWITMPLAGAIAGAELNIRVTPNPVPGASPLVTESDAAHAMRELARVAAGGELPAVTAIDGVATATWSAQLTADDVAAYENVTAGYTDGGAHGAAQGVAPDVLVGKAWPAVFALIADAVAADGTPAVEGLLNLVHLNHRLELLADFAADAAAGADFVTELAITARLGEVADTQLGRVVPVTVEISAGHATLARLEEQFAIRGRRGEAALPASTMYIASPESEDALMSTPKSFRHRLIVTAPESMHAFAVVTGDRNPIHVSDAAAALAGLPDGVIVHGMWTSALAQLAATFDGAELKEWDAQMLAPILPGQQVIITVSRSAVDTREGVGEVRSVTVGVGDAVALTAVATVAAPRTFYGFPGQGIQSQGMGMDAFAASAAARAVWERADRHTRSTLGFSILEIVRNNPASVTVRGEEFAHPDGALFLTQFTQVAMATLGCAQIAEMHEAGVLERGAYFAGHSVGEYNALAAYAQVLSLEAVLEIVYARGLTMHRLVERDEEGNSNYGLSALRPNKIGISADKVFDYVAGVAQQTGEFLEIVNYNIAGVQYAVAGTKKGLEALGADAEKRAPGARAYIPIPGIDVPFHSSHLLDGVPAFRAHLDSLIPADIDLDVLVGHYVPNLVARPFELTREFVESMAAVVSSPILDEVLADFDAAASNPVQLGRTLLIELLAWQFASPVRWIETQDLLLTPSDRTGGPQDAAIAGLGIDRFVEVGVGSSPTLANMLGQTLRLPQYTAAAQHIEVLNIERDRAKAFAEDAVDVPELPAAAAVATEAEQSAADAAPAAEAAPAAATPVPAAAPAPAAGAGTPDDKAFGAGDAVEMLVATWTKVRLDQMGATDTIEALVEGVSSRRNQLLLDLGTEFGLGAIDGAADAPIEELKALSLIHI